MVNAARRLEPDMLTLYEAKQALAEITTLKNAAAVAEMMLAKRIADTGEWKREGHRSAAEAHAAATGTSPGRARDALNAADRFASQPHLSDAAKNGELSPEQTSLISGAAAANPAAERQLVEGAKQQSLPELDDACGRAKAAADPDPDATHKRNHEARCLRFWSKTGVAKMFGQTTPDQMAAIKAAVELRAEELFHAARRSGDHQPREAYLIDALEQICREWMGEAPAEPAGDGQPSGPDGPPPAPPARRNSAPPIYLGLIRIDHAALVRGHIEGDELCEIVGSAPSPSASPSSSSAKRSCTSSSPRAPPSGQPSTSSEGPTRPSAWPSSGPHRSATSTDVPAPASRSTTPSPGLRPTTPSSPSWDPGASTTMTSRPTNWAVIERDGRKTMVPPDDPEHPGTDLRPEAPR
jgi:hypothetical protein